MAISRAQMGSQLTGNKMKKTKKMALGGVLLDKMTNGAIKAPIGIIPQMIMANRRKDRAAAAPMPEEATAGASGMAPMARPDLPARGMKRGGKVRGDGVCQRGKTKGTMR
jgi:hypothetical protein